jgi:hypothetical protein
MRASGRVDRVSSNRGRRGRNVWGAKEGGGRADPSGSRARGRLAVRGRETVGDDDEMTIEGLDKD